MAGGRDTAMQAQAVQAQVATRALLAAGVEREVHLVVAPRTVVAAGASLGAPLVRKVARRVAGKEMVVSLAAAETAAGSGRRSCHHLSSQSS